MVKIREIVAPTGGSNMERVTGNSCLLLWQFQHNTIIHTVVCVYCHMCRLDWIGSRYVLHVQI